MMGFFKRQGSHPFPNHVMSDIVWNSIPLTVITSSPTPELTQVTGQLSQPVSARAKQALNQSIRYDFGAVSPNAIIGLPGRLR